MSYGSIRRRVGQWAARYDWLEGWLTVLGVVFLATAAICLLATIVLILHLGDKETGFPAGEGLITGSKGFGLVFFPISGLVTLAVGWSLVGDRLRRLLRRGRGV
ncbi:MAG: hypothetical protein ACT4PO_15320 [Actinomycetota bacterium]